MASHFLQLLPADVQICIILSWLGGEASENGLLRVMSSLDMAVTNRTQRPAYLILVANPLLASRNTPNVVEFRVRKLDCLMEWLRSRQLHLKYLELSSKTELVAFGGQNPILSHIRTIGLMHFDRIADLLMVMNSCPHITALRGTLDWEPALNALLEVPLIHLRKLSFSTFPARFGLLKLLERHGGQLEELSLKDPRVLRGDSETIDNKQLVDAITQHCTRLKVLRIACLMCPFTVNELVEMLRNLQLLDVLDVPMSGLQTEDDFDAVLQAAGPQLKDFSVSNDQALLCGDYQELFMSVLGEHVHLDRVRVGGGIFDRANGVLHLPWCYEMDTYTQAHIVECCSGIVELDVDCPYVPEGFENLIGLLVGFGANLRRLNVTNLSAQHDCVEWAFLTIVEHCPQLESLSVHHMTVTDAVLQATGRTCKNLQSLIIAGINAYLSTITDLGVQELLQGCHRLEVLDLGEDTAINNMTQQSLRTIIEFNVFMKRFTFYSRSVSKQGVEAFYKAAKEHKLLPVPVIDNIAF